MKLKHCVPVLALIAAMMGTGPANAAGEQYVALGDSYAAGVGIPTTIDQACDRSDRNYAHLVAARRGSALTDVTCGGATTADVNATQLSAVTSGTEVVTLGIGGNDVGFSSIVRSCVVVPGSNGAGCRNRYPDMPDRLAKASNDVGALLATIRSRAPKARIVLVGYPKILPDNESTCATTQPFAPEDLAWARDTVINGLNAMLKSHTGDRISYADTQAVTTGHDICQAPAQRWINGIQVQPGSDGRAIHPNHQGQEAMSNPVLAALATGGISTGSFGG